MVSVTPDPSQNASKKSGPSSGSSNTNKSTITRLSQSAGSEAVKNTCPLGRSAVKVESPTMISSPTQILSTKLELGKEKKLTEMFTKVSHPSNDGIVKESASFPK